MNQYNSLSHTKWECKYHIVFIPKYRRKGLYGVIKKHLGAIFHELARQKECVIEEGHTMPDHVHMLVSIPPKYKVSENVGFIEGSYTGKLVTAINKPATASRAMTRPSTKNLARAITFSKGIFSSFLLGNFDSLIYKCPAPL